MNNVALDTKLFTLVTRVHALHMQLTNYAHNSMSSPSVNILAGVGELEWRCPPAPAGPVILVTQHKVTFKR